MSIETRLDKLEGAHSRRVHIIVVGPGKEPEAAQAAYLAGGNIIKPRDKVLFVDTGISREPGDD